MYKEPSSPKSCKARGGREKVELNKVKNVEMAAVKDHNREIRRGRVGAKKGGDWKMNR